MFPRLHGSFRRIWISAYTREAFWRLVLRKLFGNTLHRGEWFSRRSRCPWLGRIPQDSDDGACSGAFLSEGRNRFLRPIATSLLAQLSRREPRVKPMSSIDLKLISITLRITRPWSSASRRTATQIKIYTPISATDQARFPNLRTFGTTSTVIRTFSFLSSLFLFFFFLYIYINYDFSRETFKF